MTRIPIEEIPNWVGLIIIVLVFIGVVIRALIYAIKEENKEERPSIILVKRGRGTMNTKQTEHCLVYETNQLDFGTKVIHVLHCEFCQSRLRAVYPDKFEKEKREIIKKQERM